MKEGMWGRKTDQSDSVKAGQACLTTGWTVKVAARNISFHFGGPLSNMWRRGNVVTRTLARRDEMPILCR